MNSGECRDSWLYTVLKITHNYLLSPKEEIHTTSLKDKELSWKKA